MAWRRTQASPTERGTWTAVGQPASFLVRLVNVRHVSALKARTIPVRSFVSRTRTWPDAATSAHWPPLVPL